MGGCGRLTAKAPTVCVLVDIDLASIDRTVIGKTLSDNRNGPRQVPYRASANIMRGDSRAAKPLVVAPIEPRQVNVGLAANERNEVTTITQTARCRPRPTTAASGHWSSRFGRFPW